MKKILMTVSSCATLIGGYACDYQSEDYRIVDHMLRFGTANSKKAMENYKMDYMDIICSVEEGNKKYKRMDDISTEHFIEALKGLRSQGGPIKQRTIKSLRDELYPFYRRNGLDSLFKRIAIDSIEVTDLEYLHGLTLWEEVEVEVYDKCKRCYIYDYKPLVGQFMANNDTLNGSIGHSKEGIPSYSIHPYFVRLGTDRDTLNLKKANYRNFFHVPFNDNIAIGTNPSIFQTPSCCCRHDTKNNYSAITMKYALEGYETIFSHETGHMYVNKIYPDFSEVKWYTFDKKDESIIDIAVEVVPWIFEFRYMLEQKKLEKGEIVSLGLRLSGLLDETIYPYENYCLNLALSLASLKDKKLVDIADKTIQEIKKNVIRGGKINHTCSNDPNSSENEYGITKDGVVRYDRQKNLSIIRDLLDKIGFDGQYVIENAQNIIDDELEKLEEDEP